MTVTGWLSRGVWVTAVVGLTACHRAPSHQPETGATSSNAASVAPPVQAARIPRDAARFEIEVVDDSTARFKPREATWVQPGMTAYVVDPHQRDALVARLRIVSVWSGTAVALVTSQVTRVRTEHVILLTPPPPAPWWKSRRFWIGALTGGVFGSVLGASGAF